tara:strand:+ start:169 stop:681 length:513 start_codon:yes stop_codon:yes gene_type:complete
MNDMNTTFDTTKMRVMVETISAMGSGFGMNEEGETVFLNGRLVEKVGLDMGDVIEAHVIPNFEDKRQSIPWRAVQVFKLKDEEPAVLDVVESRTSAELDLEILGILSEADDEYWTTVDLANAVDTDTVSVGNSCNRLFNKGLVAKAEVHARPGQKRASLCLWAKDIEGFR